MQIREPSDNDNLVSLYESCFVPAHQKLLPSYISINSLKIKALENFKKIIDSGQAKAFVAEDSKKLLGFIVLKPKEGEIVNLYVMPEYQRRGIASALVSASLNEFLSLKINTVTLSVFENNYPAIKLYQKLGFKMLTVPKNIFGIPVVTLRYN